MQILIVDDHRDNLVALEAVLSRLGHRTLLAESGRAALRILMQEDVALVLLDVAMADMDGYEVAGLIHGRPANRDTPIIFITANPKSAAAVFKGYSVGAVDYIFKPVSADVLISKVNVFVDLYQRSWALKREAEELGRAHDALDLRVRERTEQLARANERLKAVIAQRRRAEAERTDLLRREQEARREAERVNRMKDQFLATLSHELRTPLNAMLGWAHLLETGQLDPDRVQRAVKVIKNSAFAQKQLIEDILDVSRIVNGRMMLNMSSVDIRSIVDGALDTLRPAAEAKQITVMTDIADVPATCGDRDRLQQIVWNLLSNAIKFTPRDGRVDVRVDTLAADVRIVVADNGQGIEPAFLPHIFDRFSQADSSMTRAHGGLGLGMSIVRHLVELHGGTVRAESEGENRGATLTVTLPIRVYREPAERPLPTPRQEAEPDVPWAELPRLDGISVLVVDDELNARQVATAILQQKGAEVAEAASAEEALALVAGGRVGVIVSDIAMPVTDGYEMMRQLRQGSGRFVPAVALTAKVTPEDVATALSAGYQRHLPKPVSAAALVRTVAELVPCRSPSEMPDRGLRPSTEPSYAAVRPPSGAEV
ncbi:MAG TPA: response regulator [Vicinamibacterales bacterium]|nr:response regulator [Vicinamibacterales bacterium]